MFYGSREDQDKRIRTLIEDNRKAAQLFPVIRKVIENFDGKVYNKRLQTALQETGERLYTEHKVSSYGGWVRIYFYGHCGYEYTLATLRIEDMQDGKRINAAKMIESARKERESHLKTAYNLEQSMQKVDEIKQQLADIEQLLKAITGKLDYQIIDTYNLPRRLTT